MNRKIVVKKERVAREHVEWNSVVQQAYYCTGGGCDRCELRYQCYTEREHDELAISWDSVVKRYPHNDVLQALRLITSSKVYVSSTETFKQLEQERLGHLLRRVHRSIEERNATDIAVYNNTPRIPPRTPRTPSPDYIQEVW